MPRHVKIISKQHTIETSPAKLSIKICTILSWCFALEPYATPSYFVQRQWLFYVQQNTLGEDHPVIKFTVFLFWISKHAFGWRFFSNEIYLV